MRCRVCKCTEDRACDPPCSWEAGQGDLCTTCADVVMAITKWRVDAYRPSMAALMRECVARLPVGRKRKRGKGSVKALALARISRTM